MTDILSASPVKSLIIDSLSLVVPDNDTESRHEQVGKIVRQLKGLAMELRVPILCLAQLHRPTEKGTPRQNLIIHDICLTHDVDFVNGVLQVAGLREPEVPETVFRVSQAVRAVECVAIRCYECANGKIQWNGSKGDCKGTWI